MSSAAWPVGAEPRVRDLARVRREGDGSWFDPALRLLDVVRDDGTTWSRWFRPDAAGFIARAPARLDVMGGIADYSGSLVLELPLQRSTTAIAQLQETGTVEVVSVREGVAHHAALPVALLQGGELRSAAALRGYFAARPDERWAAYPMGVAQACLARRDTAAPGVRLLVSSDVPEGKGVSSSAALEVACLFALAATWEVPFTEGEAAHACQRAENEVAGAPCGIMDQVTAVSGHRGRLLRLFCQPATIEGHVAIPDEWAFFGIDSGIRHAVTGADYGTVRTAAFMGYRIIAERLGCNAVVRVGRAVVDDERLHGYLANMPPDEFALDHAPFLPGHLGGAAFLRQWGGITDPVTQVDPARVYPVRQATAHPVHEHARVRRFAELLDTRPITDDAAMEMGRLMRASHDSYGACGLGSEGTDRLVQLVGEAGPGRGLYGAKITGGGNGGTVAILARAEAGDAVREVARRYTDASGRRAEVFDGSSPGAAATGVLRLESIAAR